MRPSVVAVLFLLVAAGVIATPAPVSASPADTLFMKDGSSRIGRIVSQDSVSTSISMSQGMVTVAAEDIARVGRERPRDELIPMLSMYLNGGGAVPSQFDVPAGFGIRPGVRVMISKMLGANLSLTYASWQLGFDTTLAFKSGTPTAQTFTLSAVSPRIGAFLVTPLAQTLRLLLGVDVGETFVSASSSLDGSPDAQSGISFAVRFDVRYAASEHLGLLVGAQFENFSTTFVGIEQHDLTTGATRKIGDILLAVGVDYGF